MEECPAAGGNPHRDRHLRLVRRDGLPGAGGWFCALRQRARRRRLRRGAGIGPVSLPRQSLPAVVRRALHQKRRGLGRALLLDGAEGVGQTGRAGGPAGQGHGAGRGDLVFAGEGRGCAAGDSPSRLGPGQRGAAAAGNAATEGRRGQLRLVPQAVQRSRHVHAHRPARRRGRGRGSARRATRAGPQQLRIGSDLSDQHHGLRAVRRRPCGADGHGRQRAAIAGRGLLAHRHHRLEPPRHRDPRADHGGAVAGRRLRDGNGEHVGLGRVRHHRPRQGAAGHHVLRRRIGRRQDSQAEPQLP